MGGPSAPASTSRCRRASARRAARRVLAARSPRRRPAPNDRRQRGAAARRIVARADGRRASGRRRRREIVHARRERAGALLAQPPQVARRRLGLGGERRHLGLELLLPPQRAPLALERARRLHLRVVEAALELGAPRKVGERLLARRALLLLLLRPELLERHVRRLRRRGVLRRERLRRVAHLDELVVALAQRRRRQLQLAVGSRHRRVLALQARVLLLERAQLQRADARADDAHVARARRRDRWLLGGGANRRADLADRRLAGRRGAELAAGRAELRCSGMRIMKSERRLLWDAHRIAVGAIAGSNGFASVPKVVARMHARARAAATRSADTLRRGRLLRSTRIATRAAVPKVARSWREHLARTRVSSTMLTYVLAPAPHRPARS